MSAIEVKKDIFKKTLTQKYDHDQYIAFLHELLGNIQIIRPDKQIQLYNTFSSAVDHYVHIGNYVGADNKKVALFTVCLKNDKNLENARSMQRNFVKTLLESSNCAGALVAFHTKGDDSKWRLSLVRLDYEFSKGKISEKLTPAKRYSYLVGDGEPCHTAQAQLFPIFANDEFNPGLDELEKAFSVEVVTKDFFDQYRDKYLDLKEALDTNPQFVAEAESRGFDSEQFAKKLMGQIVFLYFIQKKGWLGVNAFPAKLSASDYKKGFYKPGSKPKTLMPLVYKPGNDGYYYRDNSALLALSAEDETTLSTLVKGDAWGSGPKNFMRQLFSDCKKNGGNYFDDYLEPLFYTGLNQNRGENAFFQRFHRRIPFLNGGLFEEMDNYDWRNNDFSIPNELFSNADEKGKDDADGILDIFDRYNFTIAEDEPMEREVAIDPEMLGKVFENLLDVTDRKSKGAFYTPREIVHYMCQESLINYLCTRTGISDEDVRKFVLYGEYFRDEDTKKTLAIDNATGHVLDGDEVYRHKHHMEFDHNKKMEMPESILDFKNNVNRLKEIDNLLANVKVVDPAVGSGAFPLGMLTEIVKARDTITSYMMIDMNNGFSRLTFRTSRNAYRLKRDTIKNCIFACDIEPSATDITKLRLWLSLVIDNQIMDQENEELGYSTKPRELPNLDCNIICGNSLIDEFDGVQLITESKALDNVSNNYQYGMFDETVANEINKLIDLQNHLYDEKDHTEKENLKNQIQDIYNNTVLKQLEGHPDIIDDYYKTIQIPSKPFVLWQLYFPKVFLYCHGFDIVIGNPPYGAKFSREDKKILNKKFDKSYVPDYESADFFIELGYKLCNSTGMLSYIVPNMFMANVFAEKYRKHLLSEWNIKKIDNLSDISVFESATVRNCIIFLEKDRNNSTHVFSKLTIKGNGINAIKEKKFTNSQLSEHIDNWLNLIERDETALAITKKIESESQPLGLYAEISQGLIPYDKYRGHTEEQIKNKVWNASYKKDETFKKELRGQDVGRYSLHWNEKDWISYGEWLAAPRKSDFFKAPRILIREITNPRILATYTSEEYYNTPSIINCINFSVDIMFVLGVVNSELMSFYHNMNSPKAAKGLFPKILVNDVRNMPIKASESHLIEEISLKAKQLVDEEGDNQIIDSEIDDLVYKLYGITSEERSYIEEWFSQREKK